jgi:hypothetical protein
MSSDSEGNERFSAELICVNIDSHMKEALSRHPGESRGPEVLAIPGFRLSPE